MTAINKLRKEKELTVAEFAQTLGITVRLTKALLYGERTPSVNVLRKISKAFPDENLGDFINDN